MINITPHHVGISVADLEVLAATLFESLRAEIKGDAQPWQ
jgi:hypothetical protein